MKLVLVVVSLLFTCLGCTSFGKEPNDELWAAKTDQYWSYSANEEYEKALTIAKEQVEFAEREFPQSGFLAYSYDRLGFAFKNLKDYKNAEQSLRKALALAEKNRLSTTVIWKTLALVYQETNKKDLALSAVRKALDGYNTETKFDSSSMYHTKLILVELLTTKQDYEQASEQLKEVVEYGLSSGDSSVIMGATSAYVWLNLHLGEIDTAIRGAERLSRYYKRNNEKEKYANAVNAIGGAYYANQNYEKAVEYFRKAADYKLLHFEDSSFIAIQLKNMALAFEMNGDTATALSYRKMYNRVLK